jgi:aspartokinase
MLRRIQASAIVETRGLTRVTVTGIRSGFGEVIDRILGDDITAEFVCVVQRSDGTSDLVLGVRATAPGAAVLRIPDVSALPSDGTLEVAAGVAMIGVYGPHFRDKPGILGNFLSALDRASAPVLGVASSISSLCALLPEPHFEAARQALSEAFETPK